MLQAILILLNFSLVAIYTYLGTTADDKRSKSRIYAIAILWFACGILNTIIFFR